jgi:hypothetical protein
MTENLKLNGFTELSHNEMYAIDGGDLSVISLKKPLKLSLKLLNLFTKVGKDLGQSFIITFGNLFFKKEVFYVSFF